MKLKPTEREVHLQGIKSYWSVEELSWKILQETSVHPEMQRLFIGGEEMNLEMIFQLNTGCPQKMEILVKGSF